MTGGGPGEEAPAARRLEGDLLAECAEWVWEQLQEEGYYLAGELVELILQTERELGVQGRAQPEIARVLEEEFRMRGVAASPASIDAGLIGTVLEWEDEWLGLAGMARAES